MSLASLGWSPFFDAQISKDERESLITARVIAVHRDRYRLSDGADEVDAELRGKLRSGPRIAVGDFVLATRSSPARIERALVRRTKLARKVAGRVTEEQILAANVDTAWIVMALDDDFSVRRLERYLLLAREGGVRPVIVLSKTDLAGPDQVARRSEVLAVAGDAAVYSISALSGDGLEQLAERELSPGSTLVLVGSSGVGKSTLLNVLSGGERQLTRPIRERDHTGRHTTTARELFVLPSGALVIDTPGLREVQLWGAHDGLASTFSDLAELEGGCRFTDCTHEHEPGCAVRAAVEAGTLDPARLESHRALRRELAYLDRRQDVHLRAEEKRRWKIIHRAHRNHPKRPR